MRALIISAVVFAVLAIVIGIGISKTMQEHSEDVLQPLSLNLTPAAATSGESAGAPATLSDQYSIPGQHTYYRNDAYGFAFEVPKGFFIEEYGKGSKTPEVLLTNADRSSLILVRLAPAGGDAKSLSAEEVHQNAPKAEITNPQLRAIAPDAMGVSFGSNDSQWSGASYDTWFVYEGTLYRMTTARSLAPLEDAVMGTWRFTK